MGSAASHANAAPHSGAVVHTNQEGSLRPTSELLHITCADDRSSAQTTRRPYRPCPTLRERAHSGTIRI